MQDPEMAFNTAKQQKRPEIKQPELYPASTEVNGSCAIYLNRVRIPPQNLIVVVRWKEPPAFNTSVSTIASI